MNIYSSEELLTAQTLIIGIYIILRGGSWVDPLKRLRTANHPNEDPEYRLDNAGFRISKKANEY